MQAFLLHIFVIYLGKSLKGGAEMKEREWDKKLKINTIGRLDAHADDHHYPYEPTPYSVLERLGESGYIGKNSHLIDYGCGKGRVGFFLNHVIGCRVTGVEYNRAIFDEALASLQSYGNGKGVSIVCENAETYDIGDADCFYFFNPFSVEILQSVMAMISGSYYTTPRTMRFFFYYPNDDYVAWLMTVDTLDLLDEVDCRDLFPGENYREKILIFEWNNCFE